MADSRCVLPVLYSISSPGAREHRARQRMPHPVAARHPRAVVAIAGALEPRPHRQQVLDGDLALARVRILCQLRKVRDDRRVDIRDQAAIDGDADERGDDALRCRLDVGRPIAPRAVVIALEDDLAAAADEQAVQPRQCTRGRVHASGFQAGADSQHFAATGVAASAAPAHARWRRRGVAAATTSSASVATINHPPRIKTRRRTRVLGLDTVAKIYQKAGRINGACSARVWRQWAPVSIFQPIAQSP